jgi:hypothetical protein
VPAGTHGSGRRPAITGGGAEAPERGRTGARRGWLTLEVARRPAGAGVAGGGKLGGGGRGYLQGRRARWRRLRATRLDSLEGEVEGGEGEL